MREFRNKFIGDKAFYKMVMSIAVPIMLQNGITNFVSLLDNIMVGRLGTEQLSGTSIVNQLAFIYFLCIFGAVSGAGIFTAQFYGKGDNEGIRNTFRYKLWLCTIISILTIILFSLAKTPLINAYLKSETNVENAALTLEYGRQYLMIIIFSLPAFAISQTYASTLRECGQTFFPMISAAISVFVNLILNYLLIYGKLGLPAMGVKGAALATVISRYVELLSIILFTHCNRKSNHFSVGLYRTLRVPAALTGNILKKGTPLLINETLWATGMALLSQCYATRGINVIAGQNIATTINNIFNIVFVAMGDCIAIVVGQALGAQDMKRARDTDNKLIAFSLALSSTIALIMFFLAPLFPQMFNTNQQSRELARQFIMCNAIFMPQACFLHVSYFTLRSGGKTIVTFLFDSVFILCVSFPVALILSRLTGLSAITLFVIVNLCDLIKSIVGFVLVKKGVWIQNIVNI